MSNKPENPYAFPREGHGPNWCPGMTLRDYFAAKAMQAFLSKDWKKNLKDLKEKDKKSIEQLISLLAYEFADAMIKEREA